MPDEGPAAESWSTGYVLLSRQDCHLCEQMRTLLELELPKFGETFQVLDVDSRLEWRGRYGDVIPVLLRDGRAVAKLRLDRRGLRRIVRRSRLG
ncbi:MAG: glutaredoxin family protein [Acidobacteriota bacterium]